MAAALSDQIRSLPVLVEEFQADFKPTAETLELYKTVTGVQPSLASRLASLALTHRGARGTVARKSGEAFLEGRNL